MEFLGLFIRTMFSLALVLALAYVSIKLGSQRLYQLQFNQERLMKVVERMALGPKAGLYIIEINGEVLLIGVNENQISCMKELSPELLEGIKVKEQPVPRDLVAALKARLDRRVFDQQKEG